jgi:hypothetical protein
MNNGYCDYCQLNVMEANMQAHAEKHGFITPLKFHEAMSVTDAPQTPKSNL